jgi:hypothetical protein
LIVGTQVDLRDDPQVKDKLLKQKMSPVTKEMGERMAKELGAVRYVECSALTQYKLKDVFDEACHAIFFCINFLAYIHRRSLRLWSHHQRKAGERDPENVLFFEAMIL